MIWRIITWLPIPKNDDGYQFARRKSTWKPNFAEIGGSLYFWRPFWIQIGRHSKPTMEINSQHHHLFGNQISLKSEDFCTLHHSKPKWSPYGAAYLTPCKYPFPLKSVHFWIFNNLFWFYIGSHFEMVAILKILKTKSTTLSDDLFLCQASKGSAVRSQLNIFCTMVTMATAAIFKLFNPPPPPKSCHKLRWIFLQSFMYIDERNPKIS